MLHFTRKLNLSQTHSKICDMANRIEHPLTPELAVAIRREKELLPARGEVLQRAHNKVFTLFNRIPKTYGEPYVSFGGNSFDYYVSYQVEDLPAQLIVWRSLGLRLVRANDPRTELEVTGNGDLPIIHVPDRWSLPFSERGAYDLVYARSLTTGQPASLTTNRTPLDYLVDQNLPDEDPIATERIIPLWQPVIGSEPRVLSPRFEEWNYREILRPHSRLFERSLEELKRTPAVVTRVYITDSEDLT